MSPSGAWLWAVACGATRSPRRSASATASATPRASDGNATAAGR